jgi:hypothetical protein
MPRRTMALLITLTLAILVVECPQIASTDLDGLSCKRSVRCLTKLGGAGFMRPALGPDSCDGGSRPRRCHDRLGGRH